MTSRDITWHGHLREKVKFLVSVRVVVWVMVVVELWLGLEYSVRVLIFPPEPSKKCVKVSY